MNGFCLKQGQDLKASWHTPTQTSLKSPPPTQGENQLYSVSADLSKKQRRNLQSISIQVIQSQTMVSENC